MPEPLAPTLTELRNSVLIRTGMNVTDGSAQQYFPVVDELLRRSQKELHLEAPWLRNYVRTLQNMTVGASDYDLPDDALISDMGRVSVVNTDGKQYPLEYGDGAVRNITTDNGHPIWYEIQDQIVRVYPAPDAEWVSLVYEYHKGPSDLVGETDRPTIEGEALIQRATFYLKRHTGFGGDWKTDREEHVRYLTRLRQEQGVVRTLNMRPFKPGRGYRTVGNGAVYTSTWSPW